MIIYNVTVKINTAVLDEWMAWMRKTHIPDVMKTGMFSSYRICKVLGDDDDGGSTFAIQYTCPDMNSFIRYQEEFAPSLQQEHRQRYEGQYAAFRTLLEDLT